MIDTFQDFRFVQRPSFPSVAQKLAFAQNSPACPKKHPLQHSKILNAPIPADYKEAVTSMKSRQFIEAIPWVSGPSQRVPGYQQASPQAQQGIRGMQNTLNNVNDLMSQKATRPMNQQQQGQQCPHYGKSIQAVENSWGRLGRKVAGGIDQAMNLMARKGLMTCSKSTNPLDGQ